MKSKDKQIRELKSLNIFVSILFLFACIVAIVFIVLWGVDTDKLQQELQSCQEEVPLAEVINGNLYVGYEDGVRVGFHQDYNGTWYRCVRDCGVLIK